MTWTRRFWLGSTWVRRSWAWSALFCWVSFFGLASTTVSGEQPITREVIATNAGTTSEPAPRWERIARAACQRHQCDGLLLVAIGRWEPDKRQNESVGDDGKSFGRWQLLVTTAARYVLPIGTTSMHRITAHQYATIVNMLADDDLAADLAARELERCTWMQRATDGRGNFAWFRRANPWGIAHRLACWNQGPDYIGHVMPIYQKLKREEGP